MQKIKIAQIGVEHDHAAWIMNCLRTLPDVFEVVGFADPEQEMIVDPETGKQTVGGYESADILPYRKLYDGVPQMSVEELLEIPGLEAVAIETSEANLFKYALMAAKKGLHVHMDKPGGVSLKEFEELASVIRQTGKTLHLGYMYRYNPEIVRVLDEVKKGTYGEIYSVECQMSCRHADEKRSWLSKYQGGMMFFLGCHLIDLIYRIQGEPERVYALNKQTGINGIGRGEDFGFAVLEYKNGVSFAKTTDVEPGGFLRRQIVICGSLGTVEIRPIEAHDRLQKVGGSDLVSYSREVTGNLYDWDNDGEKRNASFDRYESMMKGFASYLRGEKENPYTLDYELKMFKVLRKACGMDEE